MNSNNAMIRRCYRRCCNWGLITPYREADVPYQGGSAPLYTNPQRTFFFVYSILNIFVLILLIVAYLLYFDSLLDLPDNCNTYEVMMYLAMAFTLINVILYFGFSRVVHASDQEWSRYSTFISINFGIQLVGFGLSVTLFVYNNQQLKKQSDDCKPDTFINSLLIFSLCIMGLLVVVQLGSILGLSVQLYAQSKRFRAHKYEPELQAKF